MKLTKTLTAAAIMAVMGISAFAIDATEIMTKVYDRKKPDTTKAAVTLTLLDKNGKVEETRNVGEYGRCKNNLSDVVMIFFSPNSVKGTRFLQKEQENADDLKKIFLPSVGNVRQVASSEGSSSFVGTDFTYDDMSTRKVEEDTHTLISESEDKGNFKDLYVVESVPVDKKKSQYSKRISWITKDSFIPTYIELYDKKGKLLKVNEVKSIEKRMGNREYNIPTENSMKNVQTGHSSVIKMLKLDIDQPLSDGYFSDAYLKNGKL